VEYAFTNYETNGHGEGLRTAILHLGADCFVRECYCPGKFPHRFTAYE
jgi:hypothetical protein